jgi:hypothetical protein
LPLSPIPDADSFEDREEYTDMDPHEVEIMREKKQKISQLAEATRQRIEGSIDPASIAGPAAGDEVDLDLVPTIRLPQAENSVDPFVLGGDHLGVLEWKA